MVRPVGALVTSLFLLSACSGADKEQAVVEQRNDWPVFSFPHEPVVLDIGNPTEQQLAVAREADVPFDTWFFTASIAPPGSDSEVGEIHITDFIVGPDSYQEIEYVVPNTDNPDGRDGSVGETTSGACNTADVELVEVRSAQTGCVLNSTGSVVWVEHGRTFSASVPNTDATTSEIVAWLSSLVVTQLGQTGAPYEMPFCSDDPTLCGS